MESKNHKSVGLYFRRLARMLGASIEIYQKLNQQLVDEESLWISSEILNKRKKMLSIVQNYLLKHYDSLEECNNWWIPFSVLYTKLRVKTTFNSKKYVCAYYVKQEKKNDNYLKYGYAVYYTSTAETALEELMFLQKDIQDGLEILCKDSFTSPV